MPPKKERFEIRLDPNTLARIDRWSERQPDSPNRSDAVRRLVERGLEVRMDDGNRLILMMMQEVFKALKIKGSEIDPDFVADALLGGHYWALEWQYSGLFHDHIDDRPTVSRVVDILDMWSFIEEGVEALSTEDKERIDKEVLGSTSLMGFDGNHESERRSIALFLVEKMGRFTRFKGRDLNSHHPTVERHEGMLRVFEPIRKTLIGRRLSADEIIKILSRER